MTEPTWRAEVMRLNPATDVLVVKVKGRLRAERADLIRQAIKARLPEIRTLIVDEGIDLVVVRKTRRKTLTLAARSR